MGIWRKPVPQNGLQAGAQAPGCLINSLRGSAPPSQHPQASDWGPQCGLQTWIPDSYSIPGADPRHQL